MTSRTINYEITARSAIDQVMNQITGSIQNMGNVSAAQIPRLARELSNAHAATTRAATALEQYRLVNAQAATAEAQAANAAIQYQSALRGLHGQAQQTSGALSGIVQAATGFISGQAILGALKAVGGGALDLAGNALTLAGDLKQSTIAFTTMLGSERAATTELKAIRDFANDTAFTFPGLQVATTRFISVGETGQQALQTVKDIADEASGRGKGPEALDRISLAMEQIHSRGVLMGQDALQLMEVGIPVWKVLGDYLNIDSAAAQELSTQGKITAATWEQAFHQDSITKFAGSAKAASSTFNGLLSTAKDLGDTLLTTLGGPIIDSLEPKIKAALDAMSDPQVITAIKNWGVEIAHVIDQVWQMGLAIAQTFGLELPQVTSHIAAADAATQDLDMHWNDISVKVEDVKAQTQGLKDSEEGIKVGAEATSRAYDLRIQKLRDAGTALERQYTLEDQIYKLHHLDDQIAKNKMLGKNIFTDTGRAALIAAEQEGEQKTELIRDMARAKAKNANTDAITALERQKQSAAQAAQDQIAGIERSIKGIEREAKAYDEYNRAKIAAIQKYRAEQEAATQKIADTSAEYAAFYDYAHQSLSGLNNGTSIDGAGAPNNGLFQKLLGTPEQQAAFGDKFATTVVGGFTNYIEHYDWQTWWDQTLTSNSLTFFENLGAGAGKAFRRGIGLDPSGVETDPKASPEAKAAAKAARLAAGGGTNDERYAADPNATSNLFDPDTWNPFSAIQRAWGSGFGNTSHPAPPNPTARPRNERDDPMTPRNERDDQSLRSTRTVSATERVHVTVGVDKNANLTAAVQNVIAQSGRVIEEAQYHAMG